MPTTELTRVVHTCPACPSQWDAWNRAGEYFYLRYRFGRGTVEAGGPRGPLVAQFQDVDDPYAGDIDLPEFLARCDGVTLAPDAVVTAEWDRIHGDL